MASGANKSSLMMSEENSEVILTLSLCNVIDGEGTNVILENDDVLTPQSLLVVAENADVQEPMQC